MKNLVLGIDVGGTNVKLGIVDAAGKILARNSMPQSLTIAIKLS
jgi:predicted NBD/HSP70 family sugar kinase